MHAAEARHTARYRQPRQASLPRLPLPGRNAARGLRSHGSFDSQLRVNSCQVKVQCTVPASRARKEGARRSQGPGGTDERKNEQAERKANGAEGAEAARGRPSSREEQGEQGKPGRAQRRGARRSQEEQGPASMGTFQQETVSAAPQTLKRLPSHCTATDMLCTFCNCAHQHGLQPLSSQLRS